jgi:hypothetical protein
MPLLLSLVLSLIPLLGVVWIAIYGSITTVDGLFMSLILLAMSGILVLNALLDVKAKLYPSTEESSGTRGAIQGLVQRGRVASVQFFEAHVGQSNKSIVMLENAPNAPHMVVVEGDVRNALPVGQKVEFTLRKDGTANVLVNVNYA